MECALDTRDPEGIWSALLSVQNLLRQPERVREMHLCHRDGRWEACNGTAPPPPAERTLALPLDAAADLWAFLDGSPLPPPLRLYLPVVLGAFAARLRGRSFVTAHLAQTLDGRIACPSGHSRWIGNPANLLHAHCLRALHDAVLVGSRTVHRDDPQLTVRHVSGRDPKRIVLNGSADTLRGGRLPRMLASAGGMVVCRAGDVPAERPAGVEVIGLEGPPGQPIAAERVCAALRAGGVHSLFVEGGGQTLSGFFAAGCIDLLHLHLAPIVLGSGVPGFVLPEIARVQDAARLRVTPFTLDGELLLECRPAAPAPA